MLDLPVLIREYDRACSFTDELWRDLSPEEVAWRPHQNSSAIGWHLGHQAHVAHFMVRNLLAAEPSPDAELDTLMDSANPEPLRDPLPTVHRLADFRSAVHGRVRTRIGAIAAREPGPSDQLTIEAQHLMTSLILHEYQHDQWISEVRSINLGYALPADPASDALRRIDGYLVIDPSL